jgi:hypothetical protein
MPKEERLPVEVALAEDGHSPAAIAGALGISRQQVAKDLQGATGCTLPDRVVGLDGKSYPSRREPKLPPQEASPHP